MLNSWWKMRLSGLVLSGVLFLCVVSRVDAKDVLPVPGYDNTFYMLIGDGYRGSTEGQTPYDSLWPTGGLKIDYQMMKLEEILSRLGPDGPYLRIGMADALWPMDVVDTSAGGDWEYKGLDGLDGSTFGEEDSPGQSRVGPDPYFNNTIMESWAQLDMPGILFIQSLGGQNWKSVDDSLADPGNLTAFLEQYPEAVQRYDDGKISVSDNADGVHSPIDYVEGLYMDPHIPGHDRGRQY